MRCAICRTETKKLFGGEKRKMYLCDRCRHITAAFVGMGRMYRFSKTFFGMDDAMLVDCTIGTLLDRKLVDEEDVMEVSE